MIPGFDTVPWTLDHVPGYGARANAQVLSGAGNPFAQVYPYDSHLAKFAVGNVGSVIDNHLVFTSTLKLGNINNAGPAQSGYFGFEDLSVPSAPIYGWAKWTTSATNTLTLNDWYYNATPGASITVGATDIPFDFNPLQGAALGVPIFIGLRQLKRRKAKLNTMVSVKGKEKIHPLALLGMGAAGVLKWRAQKDKDAA
jgi:hypothetical protein